MFLSNLLLYLCKSLTNKLNIMSDTQAVKTPVELLQARNKLIEYYSEQISVLEVQKEYETLLADIEDAKARRMMAIIKMAQMTTKPKENKVSTPGEKSVGMDKVNVA